MNGRILMTVSHRNPRTGLEQVANIVAVAPKTPTTREVMLENARLMVRFPNFYYIIVGPFLGPFLLDTNLFCNLSLAFFSRKAIFF